MPLAMVKIPQCILNFGHSRHPDMRGVHRTDHKFTIAHRLYCRTIFKFLYHKINIILSSRFYSRFSAARLLAIGLIEKGPPNIVSVSPQVADDRMALVTSSSADAFGDVDFGSGNSKNSRLPPEW